MKNIKKKFFCLIFLLLVNKIFSQNNLHNFLEKIFVGNYVIDFYCDVLESGNRNTIHEYSDIYVDREFPDPDYGEYEHYYHEGVDFSGGEDCEIRSLIRAKVIAYGWQKNGNNYSTYGKVVWLYNLDGAGVYLLAHVKGFASNIEVGKVYYPGDVVAYIGRSGANKDGTKNETRWDAHLHLSFYNFQFKENVNPLVKINGEDCSYTERNFLNFLNNPFKHNDKERMTNIRKTK